MDHLAPSFFPSDILSLLFPPRSLRNTHLGRIQAQMDDIFTELSILKRCLEHLKELYWDEKIAEALDSVNDVNPRTYYDPSRRGRVEKFTEHVSVVYDDLRRLSEDYPDARPLPDLSYWVERSRGEGVCGVM